MAWRSLSIEGLWALGFSLILYKTTVYKNPAISPPVGGLLFCQPQIVVSAQKSALTHGPWVEVLHVPTASHIPMNALPCWRYF
jgi:hypothetical protein